MAPRAHPAASVKAVAYALAVLHNAPGSKEAEAPPCPTCLGKTSRWITGHSPSNPWPWQVSVWCLCGYTLHALRDPPGEPS